MVREKPRAFGCRPLRRDDGGGLGQRMEVRQLFASRRRDRKPRDDADNLDRTLSARSAFGVQVDYR